MRAIDADELKKCVLKWLPQDPCGKEEKEMPFETDICVSMLMEIDEQPTIQPEPAQWVQMLINPRMYRCSNCNIAWNKRLVFDLDNGNEMVMKYCPCCGKKMLAEVDYE